MAFAIACCIFEGQYHIAFCFQLHFQPIAFQNGEPPFGLAATHRRPEAALGFNIDQSLDIYNEKTFRRRSEEDIRENSSPGTQIANLNYLLIGNFNEKKIKPKTCQVALELRSKLQNHLIQS